MNTQSVIANATSSAVNNNNNNNKDKETVGFNDWMFQQHVTTTTPSLVPTTKSKDLLFDSDASSSSPSSWFEPLENILSSTTSSSMGSPLVTDDNGLDEVKLEPVDDTFEFTLNKLLTQEKIKQESLDTNNDNDNDADAEDMGILSPSSSSSSSKITKRRLTEDQKQQHNRTEKRYRVNINTKIAKLQQIIPWLATEQTTFVSSIPNDGKIADVTPKKTRLNKSMILEKAVDYILYLQNNERLYEMEVMRLKSELNQYKS